MFLIERPAFRNDAAHGGLFQSDFLPFGGAKNAEDDWCIEANRLRLFKKFMQLAEAHTLPAAQKSVNASLRIKITKTRKLKSINCFFVVHGCPVFSPEAASIPR
ncbi:MAG: hypothetical protein ACLQSR_03970 [Limisphaerales bacterium]